MTPVVVVGRWIFFVGKILGDWWVKCGVGESCGCCSWSNVCICLYDDDGFSLKDLFPMFNHLGKMNPSSVVFSNVLTCFEYDVIVIVYLFLVEGVCWGRLNKGMLDAL